MTNLQNESNQFYQVVVIGAGAAGLMCAIEAAKRGRSVLVIDHANKAGKKILMSGGGRCNFTNYYVEPNNYLSKNPHFCKSALSRYTQWDFIALVDKHAVPYHEKKSGQLFCDNKSKDILDLLLNELSESGAELKLKTSVEVVEVKDDQGFSLKTSIGTITCESLVIATGGLSIPTLGATGLGYEVAEQFGHQLLPRQAGLVPFTITSQLKELCNTLSGTSCEVEVSCNQQSFTEDMLFTHRGLSGPAILQISSYWQPGDKITLNLLPQIALEEELRQMQHKKPKSQLKNILSLWMPQKMAAELLKYLMPDYQDMTLANLSGQQMDEIAEQFHRWQLVPSGTEGYRTAEVTLGGVNTNEVSSKTMESQLQPNLYFVGEVLDITGHLGGFNFQWAWASGWSAGQVV